VVIKLGSQSPAAGSSQAMVHKDTRMVKYFHSIKKLLNVKSV
jgi:hypothetical protein